MIISGSWGTAYMDWMPEIFRYSLSTWQILIIFNPFLKIRATV
jgi:hypothetical protein